MKEGFPFTWNLTLESSVDSCFRLALLHSMSYFYCLYWSPSSSLCMIFDSISSNIDKALSINLSVNLFIHHKDWLVYFGGPNRPGELCYNFSTSYLMILLRWLTFLPISLTMTLNFTVFWIYLFLLMLVFVLQWLALYWEILIMLLPQFLLTFRQFLLKGIHYSIA